MRSAKLTPAQRREALLVFETGFTKRPLSYRGLPRNRALNRLEELGLVEFDFGPRNSWLRTYGFMPVWSDPVL